MIPDDGTDIGGGWQETECETIRFVGGGPFFPTSIDVQILVGVPIRNKRQGKITPQRAHDESVEAANLAGMEVTALLNVGEISPSQIQSYFINLMSVHLLIDGRRVTTCSGGSKKLSLSFTPGDQESHSPTSGASAGAQ